MLIGKGQKQQIFNLKYANRHGLIAGATGTGKTVTVQVLAESFSRAGVPVFVADVKGDLSGVAAKGKPHAKIDERVEKIGITDYSQEGSPVIFWDLYGKQGHPVRTTLTDMGSLLLSRLMELTDAQEGIMTIAFIIAEDKEMPLIDLKDLRSLLIYMSENYQEILSEYGGVSKVSISTIQRKLLQLEQQGADEFFGEPALELLDLMLTTKKTGDFSNGVSGEIPDNGLAEGRGIINVLTADKLISNTKMYSIFLLWLISELFENLPEQGDADKPKMVFFFDEAHLLFDDAPKALLDKIEQVVRLIRSKGLGVYFVTQTPSDIPKDVLGQLGNRFQHALRAFTPQDKKAVKVAAETFRTNPDLDTYTAITQLGVGEALVSTLEDKGVPSIVDKTLIAPPHSRIGPLTVKERKQIMAISPMADKYDNAVDKESAYEILKKRKENLAKQSEKSLEKSPLKSKKTSRSGRTRQGYGETIIKTILRTLGSRFARTIINSIFKSAR